MLNHLLIFFALISFSIVSYAAAIPMDADQVATDAIQNAVLHQEVAVIQGGRADKDVAAAPADIDQGAAPTKTNVPAVSDWFAAQGDEGGLHPQVVLMLIMGLVVFFLSRKSSSTK